MRECISFLLLLLLLFLICRRRHLHSYRVIGMDVMCTGEGYEKKSHVTIGCASFSMIGAGPEHHRIRFRGLWSKPVRLGMHAETR